MKRPVWTLAAAVPLLIGSGAWARDLPNYNAYHRATPAAAVRPPATGAPAFVASTDAKRGVPTFLWAGRAPRTMSRLAAGLLPEVAARRHLDAHVARYGLSRPALDAAVVTRTHDLGRGGVIVTFRQRVQGVELFHCDVNVLMDRRLDLVAIGGNLHPAAVPTPKGFLLSESQAIGAAFADLYGFPADVVDTKQSKGGYGYFDLVQGPAVKAAKLHFARPARVKRVWFPMPERLLPAYFVELLSGKVTATTSDAYAYVIAADNGRLLYRENLTHSDTFNYRVYAETSPGHRPFDGPIADFTPHPTGEPDGSYPAFVAPNLIAMDGFNKLHDPWLAPGATVTTGNNVDAYTDDDAPDGFSSGGDIRATTTSANTFDRVYDTSAGPQSSDEQRMAAITDLFYVTNWLHDYWYDSGFDEAAGNAQKDNYGRGGVAGDPLHAEAQDGAPGQRNNSDMSVPADGESPRMQMFVWDGKSASALSVPSLEQNLRTGTADFGPASFDVTGTLALVDDGAAPVTDACSPLVNGDAIAGKIALLDRGTCTFKQKAVNAANAGAIAVILADNQSAAAPPPLYDGDPPGPFAIPILSVTAADGDALEQALASGPVSVSMSRTAAPDRDGTLDNMVIAHEWGHYIHLRQVPCGSQACGAESEGWGDFIALMMSVRVGDDLHGTFAAAQYATASFPDDPAYFGIRRYPYSVDLSKNPLTFKHIADAEPLPTSAPVAQSAAQVNNAEVHAAGEVWASMLFEAFVALLERAKGPNPPYTFEEARRRMADYVVAGMKLAPSDPTFTEQRDAILAAAAASDLDDLQALAKAFAKRGAGTCAVSPPRDSMDFSGVVESFTVQPNVSIVSVTIDDSVKSCDGDGRLDAEETGRLTVEIVNTGTAPVDGATATVTTAVEGITFPSGTTAAFGTVAPYATATASVEIAIAPTARKMESLGLDVKVDGVTSCGATTTLTTAPLVNYDEVPESATIDTIEASDTTWTLRGEGADQVWSRVESEPGNHVWSGIDFPSPSDTSIVSPPLQVSPTKSFVLTFDHRHQFEASDNVFWDGAVIEISTNDGKSWQDISKFGEPGYGGTIGDPEKQAVNVLRGRQGYVDANSSWPKMDTVRIDMGTQLAGKTVRVRFRIGTDDAAGASGWDVDNIKLEGLANAPFTALVDDTSTCGAAPIADAGPDQSVLSGYVVTLDGSNSFDPGGVPLAFAWRQTSGDPVTLSNDHEAKTSFMAPAVDLPTTLTFQLTVNDGHATGTADVNVLVRPAHWVRDGVADGDCGCSAAGAPSGAPPAAALAAAAALLLRRRRSRR